MRNNYNLYNTDPIKHHHLKDNQQNDNLKFVIYNIIGILFL